MVIPVAPGYFDFHAEHLRKNFGIEHILLAPIFDDAAV
jgi:hypothetical protein